MNRSRSVTEAIAVILTLWLLPDVFIDSRMSLHSMKCKNFVTKHIRKEVVQTVADPEGGNIAKAEEDATSSQPLSMTRTVLLGAAVAFAALCMGFNCQCA